MPISYGRGGWRAPQHEDFAKKDRQKRWVSDIFDSQKNFPQW